MITVRVEMKFTHEPLKRIPVELIMDAGRVQPVLANTDRTGVATFDLEPGSGKVLVSGIERYHGRLEDEIGIELWSSTQSENSSDGSFGEFPAGSNAYPGMLTQVIDVEGRDVLTDSEGYLVNPSDWSEAFVQTRAEMEGLQLDKEHWEVIRFLREHYAERGFQASVRDMIRYFGDIWGKERGSSQYLHKLFPKGGPQKQGNRLAGLLRTKGEH